MGWLHRQIQSFRRPTPPVVATPGQVALVNGAAYLVTATGLRRIPIYPTIKNHN
jgi:hypothetical protein